MESYSDDIYRGINPFRSNERLVLRRVKILVFIEVSVTDVITTESGKEWNNGSIIVAVAAGKYMKERGRTVTMIPGRETGRKSNNRRKRPGSESHQRRAEVNVIASCITVNHGEMKSGE